MMQLKRPKVIRKKLEIDLFKLEKRIQKLAAQAYQIRQMLADLTPEEAPINAVHNEGSERQAGSGFADPVAGQPDISDSIIAAAILAEQPTKLPDDSGNPGEPAGSGV